MTWISATFKGLSETAKQRVVAGTTTRMGGASKPPFDSFNIASHVTDDMASVMANRAILRESLALPSEPFWLHQTHTTMAVEVPYEYRSELASDAAFTSLNDHVCCAMTADCIPLLVVDTEATKVAAIHAGWRGLLGGVIENTLTAMRHSSSRLSVWIGPAISQVNFEVGPEVRHAFLDKWPRTDVYFLKSADKYLCDLTGIAQYILEHQGVSLITQSNLCTVDRSDLFFSYRRDGQCGRMASLIWLKSDLNQS